jgi:hypothetical protein
MKVSPRALADLDLQGVHGFERSREPLLALSRIARERGYSPGHVREKLHDEIRLSVGNPAEEQGLGFDGGGVILTIHECLLADHDDLQHGFMSVRVAVTE